MDVRLTGGTFAPRADFTPVREASDLFRGAPGAERVVLRYAASTAEWVAESYPDHVRLDDGRVDVAVEASSVEWLVRRALEHGTEVEVVGPPRFRDAVRRAVA